MRRLCWLGAVALVACDGGGATRPPCNFDEDCDAGLFCATGGCMSECATDDHCVALGRESCDLTRGRCLGGGIDAGPVDGGGVETDAGCTSDVQCDDGVFCNGTDRCVGGECRVEPVPCADGECDEENDRCNACLDPDRDGDGFDSMPCGGTDCDDGALGVHPTRPGQPSAEICDAAGTDEDCDPLTLGAATEDRDGDLHWPTTCCNGSSCGNDCSDDSSADPNANQRNGDQVETCDRIDNDCDSSIDESLVTAEYWPDADGDGQGDRNAATVTSCASVSGHVTNRLDCNDANGSVRDGAPEVCNNVDDNCAGGVDEGDPGGGSGCGSIGTPCQGTLHCQSGSVQCFPARSPTTEICNNFDDDCNGIVDQLSETQAITCSASAVTQQQRTCSGGGWSGWTVTSSGSQSCSRCGGRNGGTQSCQTNGTLTSCNASYSGDWPSERCTSYCGGTTWPYGHAYCVSDMVFCTPDVSSGGTNVWRIEGSSGVLGHDCGYARGDNWFVDHNGVGSNCAAVWFYNPMPPGTYRITYRVWRSAPRGTWPNVLGVDLYHGADVRFSDYRVPEGWVDLVVDNVRHNTYCATLDLGLIYRGGFWTDSMELDYVLLERVAP